MVFRRRHLASPRRRLAWLLALALLLPLAQSIAAWHALTHVNTAGQAADSSATNITGPHCDLCLTAAALGSGALPSTPLLVADFAGEHCMVFAAHVFEGAARPSHYLSRAPPFASA